MVNVLDLVWRDKTIELMWTIRNRLYSVSMWNLLLWVNPSNIPNTIKYIRAQLRAGPSPARRAWGRAASVYGRCVQLIGRGVDLFIARRTPAQDRPAARWWRAAGRREGTAGPAAPLTLILMQNFKSLGVGWRQEGLSTFYHLVNRDTSCESGDRLELRGFSYLEPIRT